MFGIDLMLMLPALVYLTVLNKTDSDAESTSKERRKIKEDQMVMLYVFNKTDNYG